MISPKAQLFSSCLQHEENPRLRRGTRIVQSQGGKKRLPDWHTPRTGGATPQTPAQPASAASDRSSAAPPNLSDISGPDEPQTPCSCVGQRQTKLSDNCRTTK
jgi:hypothetical protein